MEAQASLVGTDGAVKLHSVSYIDVHLALVIGPWHTECYDAFGFNQSFDKLCTLKLRMLVVNVLN